MTSNKFQHAGLDWVPHTPGDPMPCPPDTLVRVLLRYEQAEMLYDAAERLISAVQWDWSQCGSGSIIGWHPVEEQPDPAETHRRAVEWHGLTDAGLCLRLGELTAQELRTVRAVLNAITGN